MSLPAFDARFRREFEALLTWRRDVRHFCDRPVAEAALRRLTSLAALAPSVGFAQPWRFVRVAAPERRAAVIASFERANAAALAAYDDDAAARYARLKLEGLREAPVHLAVCCDAATTTGRGLGRATMPETLEYSAVMAIYAFWLAARTEGIGVGWVSILDPLEVLAALDVPASWKLVAYLCVGYPTDDWATPELLRAGWERRDARAVELIER